MESRIKILPPELVEKIAAGEVIERPASVVKELVENSIDAGSRKIFVFVKKGGLEEIRVVDDGSGMSEDEARLALRRHATSKINTEEDLERIGTLGFRGEALPSIAAVSRMEILTRRKEDVAGTRIIVVGGEVRKVESSGAPHGTSITVRDLFFNTPARRKFMGSERQEFGHIMGVIEKYALIYEKIHFRLVHNGRVVFDVPPGELQERVARLWGRDVARDMVGLNVEGKIKVRGLISKPYLTRKDKSRIVVFVNGRYVKNYNLTRYILDGYGTLLFRDSFPYAAVMLDIPPEMVDVNVHPAKFMVKFRDENSIRDAIKNGIWNTLTALDNTPMGEPKEERRAPVAGEVKREKQMVFEVQEGAKKKSLFDFVSHARLPGFEVLGQFDDTYIILKSRESLIIVDQHAAHERIRYERFLREIKNRKIQELIDPVVINLGSRDYAELMNIRDALMHLSIHIEDFGEGSIVVRGIPPLLRRDEVVDVIRGIIDLGPKYIHEKRDEFIKLISCKGAIKAHEKLSIYEMEELVSQLLKCENPYTCPHGRPTMIKFTPEELEKMFKRKE